MDETRYSFAMMSKVSGIDVQCLERLRRLNGLPYHRDGYTVEEVRKIIGKTAPLVSPAQIGARAKRALDLYNRLIHEA